MLADRRDLRVARRLFSHFGHETLQRLTHLRHLQRLVGDGARAAGVLDIFLPARHLQQVVRQAALRRPEIDLEGQGVAPRLAVEDPRERRIRDHAAVPVVLARSEEHTSELQSLMRISYAVFCLKKKKNGNNQYTIAHYY